MRAVVSLAWARLRYRPVRWLLVALGVAAATVLPVQAQSTSTVVAAQALRHGLAELDPGARALAAIRSGLRASPADIAALDQTARHALAPLAAGPVLVQMLTRSISDRQGHDFYFGAVDGLAQRVRLTDGRLPTSCTPARCEVLSIGTADADVNPDLGLVVVGRAVRTDPLLFGGSFDPGTGAPVLVADGVVAAAQLDSLAAFQRTYAWVTAVDLDRVQALGVDRYLSLSTSASLELYHARLTLTAPDDVLRAEADRAARSARRFGLLGGSAMALLLGFSAIGAIGLRRDHQATVELLRRRGASRRQTGVLTAIAAAMPVAAGALLGSVLGGLSAAWLAHGAGLPAMASALAAVRAAAPTIAIGAAAAAIVVGVALTAGSAAGGAGDGRGAWRAIDITIGAGILVAALAVARGAITATTLSSGTDALLLALPVIVVVCGGLAVGRAWPPVTAAIARVVPRRLLAARLGLLGGVRSPLRPVATAAFLAAATGIVAFAGSYQATLRQGALDQAAFAVPLDATIHTGASLRQPLTVAPLQAYRDTGASVYPVVRSTATVRINAAQSIVPSVVGLDPAALPAIPSWDHVVGTGSADSVAGSLTPRVPVTLPGVALPAGLRTLSFPATGDVVGLDLSAWVRLPDGRDLGTPLVLDGDHVAGDLSEPLPDGSVLFAITVTENSFTNTRRQHRTGEGGNEVEALQGHLGLAGADFTGWTAVDTTVDAGPGRLAVDYSLVGNKIVLEPAAALAGAALPVFADPATAATATGGLLTLDVGGGTALTARLAGVLPRFPTTAAAFVVADVRALADALDARAPGTGSVSELWLAGSLDRARLSAPPFDLLAVDFRQDRADRLQDDPVAQGAAGLLTSSAVLVFAVALLAVVLLVVAERRDESAQLYAWESDGVAPRSLRWSLFLRAVAVVGVGVPGGVLIGLLLSRVTTALVRLTATGADPVPPLVLSVSALWSIVAILAGLAAGLVVCGAVAAASLRERLPRRPEEGLR